MKDTLPDKMIVNRGKKKDTYYLRSTDSEGKRKKIPLGHDYPEALRKYSEIMSTGTVVAKTLCDIWESYKRSENGLLMREVSTQKDYERSWSKVAQAYGNYPLETIQTYHVRQYLDHRKGKVRANREIALMSILFNYARNYHGFNGFNPCFKIKRNKEIGRRKYIEKWEYEKIYSCADQSLKNILDMMLYTGQRVSDVLNFKYGDIKRNVDLTKIYMYDQTLASDMCGQTHADVLFCENTKTGKDIDLIITGEFKVIMDRILNARKESKISSLYLLPNDKGGRMSRDTLAGKFKLARSKAGYRSFEIQMRDLRHKSATDDSLTSANVRLAHTTIGMTEKYRNNVRRVMAMPLEKLI